MNSISLGVYFSLIEVENLLYKQFLNHIRFAFDIVTDIMVYAIALVIFSQGNSSLAQVTPSSGIDFLV